MSILYENRTPPHHKFYRIWIERGLLFYSLGRVWGRIGSRGRRKVEYFQTEREARKVYQALCRLRERHGYVRTEEGQRRVGGVKRVKRKQKRVVAQLDSLPLFRE